MADIEMEITGGYNFKLSLPAPEDSGFRPVEILPWEGVESVSGLERRASETVKQACPLGSSACQASVRIEKKGIKLNTARTLCGVDNCPIDVGAPAGYEPYQGEDNVELLVEPQPSKGIKISGFTMNADFLGEASFTAKPLADPED